MFCINLLELLQFAQSSSSSAGHVHHNHLREQIVCLGMKKKNYDILYIAILFETAKLKHIHSSLHVLRTLTRATYNHTVF